MLQYVATANQIRLMLRMLLGIVLPQNSDILCQTVSARLMAGIEANSLVLAQPRVDSARRRVARFRPRSCLAYPD